MARRVYERSEKRGIEEEGGGQLRKRNKDVKGPKMSAMQYRMNG